MKKRYLFLISVAFLLMLSAVSAHDNVTATLDAAVENAISQTEIEDLQAVESGEDGLNQDFLNSAQADALNAQAIENEGKLETSYFYDADDGRDYVDDTVVTHNLVKYYGDRSKKFKIQVYDDDYNPDRGVYVSFGKGWQNLHEKRTNANGIVNFAVNYQVGKYKVVTYIECSSGYSYYYAYNTVTIKSTIPTKTLTKYNTQKNKKFSVKFLDSKGKPLNKKKVKFKFKGKTYKMRTNSKGIAKIRLKLTKIGKYKLTAYNQVSKEKRKITVKITKKHKTHSATLKLKVNTHRYSEKRLKTGDILLACACSYDRQHYKGVDVGTMIDAGQDGQHSTKMIKGKVWYKNTRTGKVVSKVNPSADKARNIKHFEWINGYVPYKVKVWYQQK